MNSKLFSILNANTAVKALLGTSPLRVYPYGTKINKETAKPYAVYGIFNATPYNYLGDASDMDLQGVQVDIYGETSASVTACFNAIRAAITHQGYLTSYSVLDIDIDDGLYHVRMEIDLHEAI